MRLADREAAGLAVVDRPLTAKRAAAAGDVDAAASKVRDGICYGRGAACNSSTFAPSRTGRLASGRMPRGNARLGMGWRVVLGPVGISRIGRYDRIRDR